MSSPLVAAEVTPVLYEAGKTAALHSIEHGALMLEQQGALLAAQWRAVTFGSFGIKAGLSIAGQGLGNYWVERDAWVAVKKINMLSVLASGVNLPLGYNSLLSAGFNVSFTGKVKTVLPGGGITAYEFERDALFNYGFGKLASGFKVPGMAGRQWTGLDKLHELVTKNPKVEQGIGFTLYNAYIRFGPRLSYGLGVGASTLTTGLEHGNKVAVGATKKYISSKVKERFPDPNKAPGHGH